MVIDFARAHRWRVHHTRPGQYQSGRWATQIQGDAGFVDIVMARAGVVLHVELKSERGRLSPQQRAWIEEGGETFMVWRPSQWAEIVEVLR
jgi:hypothetical protein